MVALRTVRMTGPFTDEDLAEFAALLRRIDERNPTATFAMTFTDAEKSMDEVERLLQTMMPPLPERATAFARAAYHDDSFDERPCDHCGKDYRGPAVYCSLKCALDDA